MVDSENLKIELRIVFRRDRKIGLFRDAAAEEVFRALIRIVEIIAEGETFHVGRVAHQTESESGGRIDEIDHPCIGGQLPDVAGDAEDLGEFAEGPEDAAGADRVAGAHGHSVFAGNAHIRSAVVGVPEREAGNDKIRSFHHLSPVGGTEQLKGGAGKLLGAPGELHHGFQNVRIGIDQRKRSGSQDRALRHIVHDCASEEKTSRADHNDFRTSIHRKLTPSV